MIMFLLLLLLATLLIYEEKQKKYDCEEQEDFDVVLEDMINQLHCNQLEILKNKSSSLVLLNTMHSLIKSMKDNYEAKLNRLNNELHQLETLNRNIELQINKCNEECIGNFENLCDPTSYKEKLQDCLNAFKSERDCSKNIPTKMAKDKHANKEFQGTDCKQMEEENINLEIREWDCPPFDLEQEMMKSPILRSMLNKNKKEENPCLPCERKTSHPSNSTFRIYEFSSQDLNCAAENECDNFINTIKQLQSAPKRQQNEAKTSNSCEDTELMKFIKRNCKSSVLSKMSKLPKFSSNSKEKSTTKGMQQRPKSTASKVRFSEDMPNYRRCEGNSSRSNTVQNLQWYSGPYISRNLEKEKPCTPLYEFKLKNQRTRDTSCTQEPVDLQSFLASTSLDCMLDTEPGPRTGTSDCMDCDLDQMNFDCLY